MAAMINSEVEEKKAPLLVQKRTVLTCRVVIDLRKQAAFIMATFCGIQTTI
jgi:hypothetical protein